MVSLMKSDRKKSKGSANQKAVPDSAAKPDVARQYEELCRLRRKVQRLSEKARRLR
jgi:hypothetical protein